MQWLHRFAGDPEKLTFVRDTYDNEAMYDVLNSTELRLVGFQLKKVIVPPPVVAPTTARRSTRSTSAAAADAGIQDVADEHYVMASDVDESILMNCFTDVNDNVLWSAATPV